MRCWKNIILFGIKVSADIEKEFHGKPVYNKSFLETKTKTNGHEVTEFYDKEIPKVDSNHTCLAAVSWDSALKKIRTIICKCF